MFASILSECILSELITMLSKNKCTKCGQKHFPQTGKKCRKSHSNINDNENDMNLKELSKMQKQSYTTASSSGNVADTSVDSSSEEEEGNAVQLQILAELRKVNMRLDAVEDKVENGSSDGAQPKERQSKTELSKLSSKNSGIHCDKVSSKRRKLLYKVTVSQILIVAF